MVAVAIYLPYPQHALMSYKRVYPLLFAGGAGILADDYWLTQHCLEFSRKQVRSNTASLFLEDLSSLNSGPKEAIRETQCFTCLFFPLVMCV